ncbi:MAG: lambda-exonuclease family protein [Acidithiobacillus sp.]
MKLRFDLQQGSPEWLAWRSERLSDGGPRIMASDVPAILGQSPYETPHQLWLRLTGRVKAKPTSFAMNRGHRFEPLARALIEQETGAKIVPVCCEPEVHDPAPFWAACSLDGRDPASGAIFEIKVPGRASFEEVVAGKCPQKWVGQIQWQMLVTGQKTATLAVYDPGDGVISDQPSMATLQVDLDPVAIAEIVTKVTAFRNAVIRDEPPSGDAVTIASLRWYRAYKAAEQAKAELEAAQAEFLQAAKTAVVKETPVAVITESVRQGGIDYPKLLMELKVDLSESTIARFRKPSSTVVSVRKSPHAEAFLAEWEERLLQMGAEKPPVEDPDKVEPTPLAACMAW